MRKSDRHVLQGAVFPDATTWLVGLGNTLALAGQSAAFWILGALTAPGGMGVAAASRICAGELIAMGLTMMLLSPMVDRIPRRVAIVAAAVFIVATQLGSATTTAYLPLLALRAAAGISFGTLFCLSAAIGAASARPERTFALAGSIGLVVGTTVNPVLGWGSLGAAPGVFLALAALCACFAVPVIMLALTKTGDGAAAMQGAGDRPSLPPLPSAGVLLMMALMAGATNGVFVFVARIAESVGVGGPRMGIAMSGVSLFGAIGGVAAGRIGTRWGVWPLVTGLLAIGAMLAWLAASGSAAAFWVSFTAVVTLYWFAFPFILGLAAKIDPLGRVAAGTGTAKIIAAGLGAAIAGSIAEYRGVAAFGRVAAGAAIVAAMLAPLVARGVARSEHQR